MPSSASSASCSFRTRRRPTGKCIEFLARGGRYVFSVWDSHRYNSFGRICNEVIGSFFPADPPKFFEVPFGDHLIDPIKELLISAGFGEIEVSVLRQFRDVADFGRFAQGMLFGSPVLQQIRQRGGIEPMQVKEAYVAAMRRELGEEPAVMPVQAIVVAARKT